MTTLVKPVRRIVRSKDGGALVVELLPEGLSIRPLHQRTRYPALGWGWLLLQAAKLYDPKEDGAAKQAKRRNYRRAAR